MVYNFVKFGLGMIASRYCSLATSTTIFSAFRTHIPHATVTSVTRHRKAPPHYAHSVPFFSASGSRCVWLLFSRRHFFQHQYKSARERNRRPAASVEKKLFLLENRKIFKIVFELNRNSLKIQCVCAAKFNISKSSVSQFCAERYQNCVKQM